MNAGTSSVALPSSKVSLLAKTCTHASPETGKARTALVAQSHTPPLPEQMVLVTKDGREEGGRVEGKASTAGLGKVQSEGKGQGDVSQYLPFAQNMRAHIELLRDAEFERRPTIVHMAEVVAAVFLRATSTIDVNPKYELEGDED
eukprot:CAMPEP_0113561126 /NCGR_PEP_ID=MMETSP0015_2-20120614/19811_1 /TAXON_ID=2838 /ORGANISM="Odontella" /LENGTH=144 /DNA_ID=CAMNT_0000462903 /DNA_START=655 /DNA_END=1090 /DNA_ORIENTATION=+ /assembly_acc=CAM_ASM_000160